MAEISLTFRDGMVVTKPVLDDDEDEAPGRILTIEEFIERVRNRSDIFGVDRNHRLRNTELITLMVAIIGAMWASTREVVELGRQVYNPSSTESKKPGSTTFIPEITVNRPSQAIPQVINYDKKKVLRPRPNSHLSTASVAHHGSGNPLRRVAQKGVLGLLSQKVKGNDAPGDLFSLGGHQDGIDAIMKGQKGLSSGSHNSFTRKGLEGIGYGPGYGPSGFNEGVGGGIDDLVDQLMSPRGAEINLHPLTTGPPRERLEYSMTTLEKGGAVIGGRTRASIMRVVMQNIAALRYAYNQRLRDKPSLKGKVTIRFAVDEFGNVLQCEIVDSSINDEVLESSVVGKIKRWRFEKIDKPGDITEIIYPFVFSA